MIKHEDISDFIGKPAEFYCKHAGISGTLKYHGLEGEPPKYHVVLDDCFSGATFDLEQVVAFVIGFRKGMEVPMFFID